MNSKSSEISLEIVAFGILLAGVKLIYSFFDAYNVLDLVVFLFAGIILGARVPSDRRPLGLLLALPSFVLCLVFTLKNGFSSIMEGVGTSYAISLVLIPLATGIGLWINSNRNRKEGI